MYILQSGIGKLWKVRRIISGLSGCSSAEQSWRRGGGQDLGSKKCLDLLSASGRDNSGDQRATKEINKEKQQNRPDERDFQKEDPRPSGLFFVCAMGAF